MLHLLFNELENRIADHDVIHSFYQLFYLFLI